MGQYILALSLALQLAAAAMAIALVRTTRSIGAWALIAAALVLMTGRRAITLVDAVSGRVEVDVSAELVALLISLAMVGGVARIRPVFTRMRDLAADLADREHQQRRIIEAAPDGIALVLGDRCVYANAALVQMLGDPEGCDGRCSELFQRVHPEDLAEFLEPLQGESDTATIGARREVRFLKADGSYGPLELVYGPTVQHAGLEPRLIQLRDLSERKKLEAHLVEATKMEAIGRLSGGIAHDFNNLLTVVVASLDLARIEVQRGHDPSPELDAIDAAATRASKLTSQLLAFARSQPVSPSAFDLNELVTATAEMLQRILPEAIKLRIELADGPIPVMADEGQIEQVLMNLAVNAFDAMPGGGTLTLGTERAEQSAPAADATGGRALPAGVFTVTDDGCGLAPEVEARIFEPFFTTKEVGSGTGLGLSSSLGIVSRAGGEIAVESEAGRGSTFRVVLPGADTALRELDRMTLEPRAAQSPNGERILLVEDEVELARLAARVLAMRGYEVVSVTSGEAALSALRAGGPPPDLLVTDVIMPDMDGTELARRVRASHPSIPVLFVTGYGEHVLELADDLGALQVLRKPFTPNAFARRVRTLLDATYPAASRERPAERA